MCHVPHHVEMNCKCECELHCGRKGFFLPQCSIHPRRVIHAKEICNLFCQFFCLILPNSYSCSFSKTKMSFEEYQPHDLLASITSAFDLAAATTSTTTSETNGKDPSPYHPSSSMREEDTVARHEDNPRDTSAYLYHHSASNSYLPSFGQVYSSPPHSQQPQDAVHQVVQRSSIEYFSGQDVVSHLANEGCYSYPTGTPPWSSFPGNSASYHDTTSSNVVSSTITQPAPNTRKSRSGKRGDVSRKLQELKLKYNRTLSFLKETDLYDVTMKAADILTRNHRLQAEIDRLLMESQSSQNEAENNTLLDQYQTPVQSSSTSSLSKSFHSSSLSSSSSTSSIPGC